jgi:hypothetical protein
VRALYSLRSERAFCERLNYDLLFKWFLDLPIDAKAFDPTTSTKKRARLLEAEIADRFFAAVVGQAKLRRYLSSDDFSVDGTLLEAWASHKSFKPKNRPADPSGPAGRNVEVDFRGEKRTNQTHASTTVPEALLARKSNKHPSEALLRRVPAHGEPHHPDRRYRADPRRRLRRASHGPGDACPATPPTTSANRRCRQGLRHRRLHRRLPGPLRDPARRPAHQRPALRDR